MQEWSQELTIATRNLPGEVARAMRRALQSGRYRIGAGSWEGGPGQAVCPIVAAGMVAGVWREGHCADGGPAWGTEEHPNEAVMEFAVCWDLHSQEAGTEQAVSWCSRRSSPPGTRLARSA